MIFLIEIALNRQDLFLVIIKFARDDLPIGGHLGYEHDFGLSFCLERISPCHLIMQAMFFRNERTPYIKATRCEA